VPAELPQRVRGFLLGKLVSEPRLPWPGGCQRCPATAAGRVRLRTLLPANPVI